MRPHPGHHPITVRKFLLAADHLPFYDPDFEYLVTAAEAMSRPDAVTRTERSLPQENKARLDITVIRAPASRAEAARTRTGAAIPPALADPPAPVRSGPGANRPRR